jgi:hypothetical protein
MGDDLDALSIAEARALFLGSSSSSTQKSNKTTSRKPFEDVTNYRRSSSGDGTGSNKHNRQAIKPSPETPGKKFKTPVDEYWSNGAAAGANNTTAAAAAATELLDASGGAVPPPPPGFAPLAMPSEREVPEEQSSPSNQSAEMKKKAYFDIQQKENNLNRQASLSSPSSSSSSSSSEQSSSLMTTNRVLYAACFAITLATASLVTYCKNSECSSYSFDTAESDQSAFEYKELPLTPYTDQEEVGFSRFSGSYCPVDFPINVPSFVSTDSYESSTTSTDATAAAVMSASANDESTTKTVSLPPPFTLSPLTMSAPSHLSWNVIGAAVTAKKGVTAVVYMNNEVRFESDIGSINLDSETDSMEMIIDLAPLTPGVHNVEVIIMVPANSEDGSEGFTDRATTSFSVVSKDPMIALLSPKNGDTILEGEQVSVEFTTKFLDDSNTVELILDDEKWQIPRGMDKISLGAIQAGDHKISMQLVNSNNGQKTVVYTSSAEFSITGSA